MCVGRPPLPPPKHSTKIRLFHLLKFIHAVVAADQWFSNCGACPPRGALQRGRGTGQPDGIFSLLYSLYLLTDSEDHKRVINIYETTQSGIRVNWKLEPWCGITMVFVVIFCAVCINIILGRDWKVRDREQDGYFSDRNEKKNSHSSRDRW